MGKSAAAQFLLHRGIPVVDTDLLAREIVEPGQPALAEIRDAFGQAILGPDGRLRRDELARIVFSDESARQRLESITHPRIRSLWRGLLGTLKAEGRSISVVVIPLLFETGAQSEMDETICVACTTATQRKRLLERGWTERQIEQRNAAQLSIETKMARAGRVVWTEGSLEILDAQLERIFRGGAPVGTRKL